MNRNLLEELRRTFNFFNKSLFDGQLPIPAFVTCKKKCILGFHSRPYEITVGKLFFSTLSVRLILDDLLHQMCHVKNHLNGTKDQTTNEYHNKRFVESALAVGLTVARCEKQGYFTGTGLCKHCPNCNNECRMFKPSEAAMNALEGTYTALLEKMGNGFLSGRQEVKEEDRVGRNYFLKYVCGCPSPHNSIRSGRRPDGRHRLNIICQDCQQYFTCVDYKGEGVPNEGGDRKS